MRLIHYSGEPFTFDPSRQYEGDRGGFKPCGLWLSVQGKYDWREWCEAEKFNIESLKYQSEVKLKADANVLVINTVKKLDAFNDTFRLVPDDLEIRNIRWDDVRKLYDGLIIAPYQWDRRLNLMWYYGWDCASGVIWNLRAVAKVSALIENGKAR